MTTRVFLLLLLMGIVPTACKKVVRLDLRQAASQLVIEGEITDHQEPVEVMIYRTVPFSDDNVFPPVSGAIVKITDSTRNKMYLLKESAPGMYSSNDLVGIPSHTYLLSVLVDGTTYNASSTMPAAVAMDSVTFALNTTYNNQKDINAIVNFQDPPGLGNYYQFIEYLNGRLLPNTFVFEDRLSDGRYIEEPLYNDSTYLHKGDTLLLKMYCVDKPVYEYFYSLVQATGTNSFQSATPANPVSNISNGALGYFSAHTTAQEKLIVY